jgi:hypothetical protein
VILKPTRFANSHQHPQCIDRQCECVYVKSRRGGARYPRSKPPISNTPQQRRSPSDHSFASDADREWECKSRYYRTFSSGLICEPAHLSSLSTPGSGLLRLDDSIAQINPGCCSLPTQPTEMTKPTGKSTTSISPALQTSDFGGSGLDDPIRTYGSDQTL